VSAEGLARRAPASWWRWLPRWPPGFEYRRISERQTEKHAELRRQGRSRGRPSADPALADRMIQMRAEGMSLRGIGAVLEEEGAPLPQGGAHWYSATVRSAIITRERELAAQVA
jgi:hypothetical protein